MQARVLTRRTSGLVTLIVILALCASIKTPVASAWSWNEAVMSIDFNTPWITCDFRDLELAPGWYDVQSYINRGTWKSAKWGSIQRRALLVKKRALYTWKVCGEIHRYKEPYETGGHSFKNYVTVDSDLMPPPGGGYVPPGTPTGLDSPVTVFPTNSRAGKYLIGSRIYRTGRLRG